jgi:hypothetical protein
MSDFLRDLVGRTLGVRDVVRPRPASAFERSPVEPALIAPPAPRVETAFLESVDEVAPPAREWRATGAPGRVAPAPLQASASEPRVREFSQPGPGVAPAPIYGRSEPTAVPSTTATAPPARAPFEQPAEPAVHEPRRGRADSTTAGPTGRRATPSPSAASSAEPPAAAEPADPPEPADPAEPAAARARLVETRLAERRVDAPSPAAPGRAADPSAPRRRRPADPPAAEPTPEPVVHVHIGRIEVRGPAAPAWPQAPRPREPLLSLDDYLAQTSPRRR